MSVGVQNSETRDVDRLSDIISVRNVSICLYLFLT